MRQIHACCVSFLALAALPCAAHAAAPQYLVEARCLGVYEAGYFIFRQLEDAGANAGAGALIAGAVNGAAKMSYEQTIDAVIARADMTTEELTLFRDTHLASSDSVLASYQSGVLDLFATGQLIYDCDEELGYTVGIEETP